MSRNSAPGTNGVVDDFVYMWLLGARSGKLPPAFGETRPDFHALCNRGYAGGERMGFYVGDAVKHAAYKKPSTVHS